MMNVFSCFNSSYRTEKCIYCGMKKCMCYTLPASMFAAVKWAGDPVAEHS